jgi:hypothetical protein
MDRNGSWLLCLQCMICFLITKVKQAFIQAIIKHSSLDMTTCLADQVIKSKEKGNKNST